MSAKLSTTALANWFGSYRTGAGRVGKLLKGCAYVTIGFAGGMCEVPEIDARTILVNDLHRDVINMSRVMADEPLAQWLFDQASTKAFHPDELAAAQRRCKDRRERFEQKTSGLFGSPAVGMLSNLPDADWALDYFICTWMGRGAGSGTKGELNQSLPIRFDAGGGGSSVRYYSAVDSIKAWQKILRRCEFTTLDIFELLPKVKDDAECGLYLDPPFPGPGDAYLHQLGPRGQERLAKAVGRFEKTRCVMRFYDHPLIRDLYQKDDWRWIEWEGRKQTNEGAPEVLLVRNGGAA